jgi:hypothetical protein
VHSVLAALLALAERLPFLRDVHHFRESLPSAAGTAATAGGSTDAIDSPAVCVALP